MTDSAAQVAFFVVIGVLAILTAGTPDLLDAIIAYIGRH